MSTLNLNHIVVNTRLCARSVQKRDPREKSLSCNHCRSNRYEELDCELGGVEVYLGVRYRWLPQTGINTSELNGPNQEQLHHGGIIHSFVLNILHFELLT